MTPKTSRTTCPMDCPDACSLEVRVDNGRVAAIRGSTDHPTTAGFICDKIAGFHKRVYHEDRLLHPLRRRGPKGSGDFERIGWDEAIAVIAERLRAIRERWGGEAIVPYHYGGSNGYLSDGLVDAALFARLGASRLGRTLCAAPSGAVASGMYGKMPGVAFEDYPEARCIFIWGANPKASNIHLVPFLKEARRRGAFIAAIDPRNVFSAGEIDLHLPVFPGTDLPVALSMIRLWSEAGRLDEESLRGRAAGWDRLLEQAGRWPVERAAAVARVDPADIRRLAEIYAASSPALLRVGWGLERNRNGGQAIAAILAMPALLGKFGVRGGGYTLSNSGAARLDSQRLIGSITWTTRELNMTRLGHWLGDPDLAPPVRGLFVYNCNPAATAPEQNRVLAGLRREEIFTVVHDQVMTDTALLADVVLPATTFLEHHDIARGYGAYVVGGVRPVIAAAGEAKPNDEVFALLGRALGLDDAVFHSDSATLARRTAEAIEMPGGRRPDSAVLEAGRVERFDFPGERPVQFLTVLPRTRDGKADLLPACLGRAPYEYREGASLPGEAAPPGGVPMPAGPSSYPLALITPASRRMISSTLGEYNFPELSVAMNPADASARGIAEGAQVRVYNELGEVICVARLNDRLREGVVAMAKGAWRKSSRNGLTSTALCPATVDNVGGGACYNDARVEVTPG